MEFRAEQPFQQSEQPFQQSYQPYRRPSSQEYHLNIHLKPMLTADSASSRYSNYSTTESYEPLGNHTDDAYIQDMKAADEKLKHWIRILKLVSRIVAALLSAATLVPISMTLIKFLETRNITYVVEGKERTAWAKDTITWYTYMYFGISAISFVLNTVILVAYFQSIRRANSLATAAGWWTGTVFVSHIIVWAVAAGLYRHGKEPVDGKFKDLWGWTCSTAAQELQSVLTDVQFEKYCNIQSYSWYSGLANTGGGILSVAVYIAAVARMKSKKGIKRMSTRVEDDAEPLRANSIMS